ncbi:hypothetical protein [Solemya velum gill symbiont]|uniref:hypothetical protein n=1 Tax=Solemya velum gill symbiont TaxID=2340 RepID=UPI0009983314|nr:hypothetical protein [Solemya velum gill symbiont]OOZ17244.1 hypothetical protein BOW29_11465 [Solemya velum gill symbiont]OOZ20513.1 hypothetical protein BOW30_12260 [Solemya velum gill symbiont]
MTSVSYTETFRIDQPRETLFPLFSAEGEKFWVPEWDYTNIMGTTELHEDYIFLTSNHDHASADAIWLVKRYEPGNYYVQFYKVEPEDKVGLITVKCLLIGENLTDVEVTYQYTALGGKGEEVIQGFTSDQYKEFISEWKNLLVSYFKQQV